MSRNARPRVLVAGVGNVLTGDDGFGVRVVEAIEAEGGMPAAVRLMEVGIGGVHLVQELMDGYGGLIVVDAVDRDDPPGTVRVLEPSVPPLEGFGEEERRGFLADTHYAVPAKAMILARALDVLPPRVAIVGCQPESLELGMELSGVVEEAVAEAAGRVRALVEEWTRAPEPRRASSTGDGNG